MGIHWYHCNPTFLWKFNLTLVRRRISALIWDISGLRNRSDGGDYREKRIVISRFLALYINTLIRRAVLGLIKDISELWNRSDDRDFREIQSIKKTLSDATIFFFLDSTQNILMVFQLFTDFIPIFTYVHKKNCSAGRRIC